jgi:hypothetical protein
MQEQTDITKLELYQNQWKQQTMHQPIESRYKIQDQPRNQIPLPQEKQTERATIHQTSTMCLPIAQLLAYHTLHHRRHLTDRYGRTL